MPFVTITTFVFVRPFSCHMFAPSSFLPRLFWCHISVKLFTFKSTVFCDDAVLCGSCLHTFLRNIRPSFPSWKIEEEWSSKSSVNICQTTRHHTSRLRVWNLRNCVYVLPCTIRSSQRSQKLIKCCQNVFCVYWFEITDVSETPAPVMIF
jgi:hypothetical protein